MILRGDYMEVRIRRRILIRNVPDLARYAPRDSATLSGLLINGGDYSSYSFLRELI